MSNKTLPYHTIVGPRPRVYYTLTNFREGGASPHCPLPLQYAGASIPRIWEGAKNIFFEIWKFACCFAMRFVKGVRGHAPLRKIFKWCNLVRYDVYLDQILTLIFFFKVPFLYNFFFDLPFFI